MEDTGTKGGLKWRGAKGAPWITVCFLQSDIKKQLIHMGWGFIKKKKKRAGIKLLL